MANTVPVANEPNHREPSIFISHSSRDIIVARAVRNLLEDRNHNFVGLIGLASYTTATEAEIFRLLETEIKARDWLLLVDSENARSSKYVQYEMQIAKKLGKPFYTIGCDRFINKGDRYEIEHSLQPCIASFSRGLRVFLSYAHKDSQIISAIYEGLRTNRFEVWQDVTNLAVGVNWQDAIQGAIEYTAEHGVFLLFLTQQSMQSQWIRYEMEMALSKGGMFIPVILEPVKVPENIHHLQYLDLTQVSSINEIVARIIDEITQLRHRRFTQQCGGHILHE